MPPISRSSGARRQQLHARIAEVVETRFGQTTESEPGLLAHHYRQAGLLERAVPYTIRAGDLASKGFAFVEARARYQEALELARALPPSEQASRFQIRATLKLANVASNRKQFEHDLADLEQARSLAEQLDHRPRLGQIYYWMARIQYVLGQLDPASSWPRWRTESPRSWGMTGRPRDRSICSADSTSCAVSRRRQASLRLAACARCMISGITWRRPAFPPFSAHLRHARPFPRGRRCDSARDSDRRNDRAPPDGGRLLVLSRLRSRVVR